MKKNKRKELHIFALNNDFSGSNRALSTAIKQLIADDFCIILHTSNSKGHLSNLDSVVYKRNFYFYSSNKMLTLVSFFVSQFYQFFYIVVALKASKHAVLGNTALSVFAIFSARLKGCCSIIYVHETFVNPRFFRLIARFIIKNFATHIIFVSHFVKHEWHLGHRSNTVVSNVSPFPYNSKKITGGPFRVLMPSSPRDYKGIPEFFELARANTNMLFHLVLSGSKKVSERYLSRFQLPSNLELTVQPNSMFAIYQKASVVLNLSRTDTCKEAFGLTIVEAFSFSLPVIVPPVGGPAEIVRDQIDGFHIDSTQIKHISSLLYKLKTDDKLYKKISQSARERCKNFQKSAISQVITKHIKIYD